MTTATKGQYQQAIDKAQQVQGWKRVRWAGPGRWRVRGMQRKYFVTVNSGGWTCECAAGSMGRVCYHQASVLLVDLRNQSAGRASMLFGRAAVAA